METERLARIRAAAERVARSYGLEIFDVQLRRESIGRVLRVIIDRPDRGVPETPDEAVGIEDCQRVSQDLSAVLDVEEEELGEAALDRSTPSRCRRRGSIGRCGTKRTTAGSPDGWRRS